MSEPDGPATSPHPPTNRLHSDTPKPRRRALGIALAVAGASLVCLLTLWPLPADAKRAQLTPLWCLVCGTVGMQDVLQNVLMLVPFGLGLGLAGWRLPRATLAGLALAFGVELLQYTVIPGRDASLSDVVTNTLGTSLGAFIATHIDWLLHPPPRDALRLAGGAVAGWAALWVAAGWLLGASPGPAPWHAVLQPEMIDAPPYPGRIVAADFAGTPLPPGRHPVSGRALEAYGRDSVAFRAEVVAAAPVAVPTGLLEVRDGDSTVQLTVREQDGSVRFAMRTNSSRLLLRPIAFRAPASAPVAAGTPLVLSIRRDAGTFVVLPRRAGESEVRAAIGPHWLATLLLPVEGRAGLAWELFAYLWVTALLLAGGWWVAHAPDTAKLTLAFLAFAIVIGGLRSVPPVFHLSHTSAVGWLMACGGLGAGLLLGRLLEPSGDA